jgi:hypothetical protein
MRGAPMIAVMLSQPVAESILSRLEAAQPLEAANTSSLRDAIRTALELHQRPELIHTEVTVSHDPASGETAFLVTGEDIGQLIFQPADELVLGRLRELIAVQRLSYPISIGIATQGNQITRCWQIDL